MAKKKTGRDKVYQKEVEEQKSIERSISKEARVFKKRFAKQTLKLVTNGFGLVAALAWNELIKEVVAIYVKPYFGQSSGLISLLIYALLVTGMAVIITYQLGKIVGKEKED